MNRSRWYCFGTAVILMLLFSFSLTACGPSRSEKQAPRKAERERVQQRSEQAKGDLLREIKVEYDYALFPGEGIPDTPFTYDLQMFFARNSEKVVLFGGYLEDVERSEDDFTVELACPVGAGILDDQSIVSFRLRTNVEQAKTLLKDRQPRSLLRSLRFFSDPEFFVIARITSVTRARRYEVRASTHEKDDIEINVDTRPRFVATGELIATYSLPKESNKSDAAR